MATMEDVDYSKKAKEAEEITSKGLCNFVLGEFNAFTQTTKNIDKLKIKENHRIGKPAYTNMSKDAYKNIMRGKARQNPFQICKCYMPYNRKLLNYIEKADFYTLINVICDFVPFQERLSDVEPLYFKAREQAEYIDRLAMKALLTEKELLDYVDLLIRLLVKVEAVDKDTSISDARKDLEKMKISLEPPAYKRYTFSIEAWNTCIDTLDKKKVYMLLDSAQLPDMKTLNRLCQNDAFGRKSDVAIDVCKKICAFMKSFSTAITDVWPSRKAVPLQENEKFDIKFVVITEKLEQKSMEDLEKHIQSYYDVLPLRDCDHFSSEEEDVMNYKGKVLTDEDRDKIRACISKNANILLQKHTYLSVISGSQFRSVGYGRGSHEILDTPCIVLNVHYKGYIPIDEEPFSSEYDGVKVDVREDVFILYNQTAQEKHDNLKYGCLISGEKDESGRPAGTLSGFAIHPEYGLCGLSCSHTLLSPSELNKINQQGQIDWSLPSLPTEQNKTQKNVYQPFKNDAVKDKNRIGQLVKVIYRSGTAASQGMDACGMDVALFQLSKRLPESSDFPVVQEKIQAQFESGAVAGFAWHDETALFSKYGAITGYTVGIPLDSGISCKQTCTWTYYKKSDNPQVEFEFTLHNQLCFIKDKNKNCHIMPWDRPHKSNERFAWKGDSGSLMYRQTTDGNLVCVGIIEGGRKGKNARCYVTPILPVLKAMGITNFKNFESERMGKDVKSLVTDMKEMKEEMAELKSTVKTLDEDVKKMKKEMTDINSTMAKGFADVLEKFNQKEMSNISLEESEPNA
ncbi:uncharacterized protein LOC123526501 isoform X2 [Mercenaria mercenaria]|uniref:uncharacterized protein LOC123526501 isoform X2 n=1 Tax=Mercenaria mercenaria TaxID=6596 RepID=UPI00234F4AFD|nr:uncharacterized protein LOC123526501 isoform X2 [Mercenaria mercenaria]